MEDWGWEKKAKIEQSKMILREKLEWMAKKKEMKEDRFEKERRIAGLWIEEIESVEELDQAARVDLLGSARAAIALLKEDADDNETLAMRLAERAQKRGLLEALNRAEIWESLMRKGAAALRGARLAGLSWDPMRPPLLMAVRSGRLQAFEEIWSWPQAREPIWEGERGETLAHEAAEMGQAGMLAQMAKKGISMTAQDRRGRSPLDAALDASAWEAAEWLIAHEGPSALWREDPKSKRLPAMVAARAGRADIAEIWAQHMIEAEPSSWEWMRRMGQLAEAMRAAREGSQERIEAMSAARAEALELERGLKEKTALSQTAPRAMRL